MTHDQYMGMLSILCAAVLAGTALFMLASRIYLASILFSVAAIFQILAAFARFTA